MPILPGGNRHGPLGRPKASPLLRRLDSVGDEPDENKEACHPQEQVGDRRSSKPYEEASFKAAQAAGKPVIVHVTAPWCPTCKAQDQAIEGLSSKPEFSTLTLFKVDYDTQQAVMKGFKANSQSTLIAFNGVTETGRLVGQTKPDAIGAVFATTVK